MYDNSSFTVMFVLNTTLMGGGNISLINLIKELYKYNINIYIVHPDNVIDSVFFESLKDVVKGFYKVKLYHQTYPRGNTMRRKVWKYAKKILCVNNIRLKKEVYYLSKIVRDIKPDIIHTNVGPIHSGFFVAKKYGIPHVWHLREYQTKDFGWDIYPSKEKYISYLKDSYVISITKDIIKYFNQADNPKAICIYNGCFPREHISSILPKDKYFLCCSRVSKEKGHDDVIKAFSIFFKKHPDYKLIIAGFGNGEYIEYLQSLSKTLECDEAIEYVGFLKDITPYMDYATALIVASHFEGFGRMTAEAAFRGCIVIGRDTGGTKEIIDETGGIRFSKGYEELAARMSDVVNLSQTDYKKIMDKAQRVATELYSNEGSGKKVYDLYTSILNR